MPLTRTARVRWHGGRVTKEMEAGASEGLRIAAQHVLGVSRAKVPIEEGTLERSGTASVDGLTAAVSYDTPYAVRQHEELTWRHDPGRQAKYLEEPLDAEAGTVRDIVARSIRESLK